MSEDEVVLSTKRSLVYQLAVGASVEVYEDEASLRKTLRRAPTRAQKNGVTTYSPIVEVRNSSGVTCPEYSRP